MKKIIVIILIIISIFNINKKGTEVYIPDEAIRFRIIANSNTKIDQNTKLLLRNNIQKELYNDVASSKSVDEARNIVSDNITKYNNIVEKTVPNTQYNINYGINHFPEKEYKGVKYKEGDYESLVITLGEGLGDNWWCVLFPPLCLLESEETEEKEEIEYKSYILEIIDKYF